MAALAVASWPACGRAPKAPAKRPVFQGLSDHPDHSLVPQSMECGACHADAFRTWSRSHHAWANRSVMPRYDAVAFRSAEVRQGSARWRFGGESHPVLAWSDPDAPPVERSPAMAIGLVPLVQYLVSTEGGRLQVPDMAWDPAKKEWFSIYGDQDRRSHEWGHWTQRGMNWNSQCAWCHMTGLRKNYDAAKDEYRTTWVEQGVGCAQCHGPVLPSAPLDQCMVDPKRKLAPRQWLDLCATCHSRREEMDEDFQPGDNFHDHYRMALPSQPGLYHPDGQQLDEVYVHASFLMSKMGHAGVTCLDCHDPHHAKPKLTVADDGVCLQCHGPGKQVGVKTAKVINPFEHSFHKPGTEGGKCVDCHMPRTPYMGRDPRRDHLFVIPDPMLGKELGIPDACVPCHADKGVEWNIEWTDKWYGDKMKRPERERTRAVAKAQAGDPGALDALLAVYPAQEIGAWKATLLRLLVPWAADPRVEAHAVTAAASADPVVRAAAAQVLATTGSRPDLVAKLLDDPVKAVRFEAAWTGLDRLSADHPAVREVAAVARHQADQPAGAYRLARLAMVAGAAVEAEGWFRKAMAWDRSSSAPRRDYAVFLAGIGRTRDSIAPLREAAALEPANPELPYLLALAQAELGDPAEAEKGFREALRRDPRFARAHYNLGLLLAGTARTAAAIDALRDAERCDPASPDAPHARATIHARLGQLNEAAAAAHEALRRAPGFTPARDLLQNLGRGGE